MIPLWLVIIVLVAFAGLIGILVWAVVLGGATYRFKDARRAPARPRRVQAGGIVSDPVPPANHPRHRSPTRRFDEWIGREDFDQ